MSKFSATKSKNGVADWGKIYIFALNSNGGVREYCLVTLAEIIHIAPVQIMLTLEVWSHL